MNDRNVEFPVYYQDDEYSDYKDVFVSIEDGFWMTKDKYGYMNIEFWSGIIGISKEIQKCGKNVHGTAGLINHHRLLFHSHIPQNQAVSVQIHAL